MMHPKPSVIYLVTVGVAIETYFCFVARSFGQAQLPNSRPVQTTNFVLNPPPQEPWWQDPRWWAIGITAFLTLLGLWTQWRNRTLDRREKEYGDAFDSEIRNPVCATYTNLRALANEVVSASDELGQTEREAAIKQIREQSARRAFTAVCLAAIEAEKRISLDGLLSDQEAELEDIFYVELEALAAAASSKVLRAASDRIATAIIECITSCDLILKEQRKKHVEQRRGRFWGFR